MNDFKTKRRLAKEMATNRHVFDKRQTYQGLPYTHHLEDVESRVLWFCHEERLDEHTEQVLRIAAWLHDIVEDTDTKQKEIDEAFGFDVGTLVAAVTNEPGPNRRARQASTYPRMREVPLAVLLKLADRYANIAAGGVLYQMYAKEHEDFKRTLYTPGQWERSWELVEDILREVSQQPQRQVAQP